jgi:hypothetical protein
MKLAVEFAFLIGRQNDSRTELQMENVKGKNLSRRPPIASNFSKPKPIGAHRTGKAQMDRRIQWSQDSPKKLVRGYSFWI